MSDTVLDPFLEVLDKLYRKVYRMGKYSVCLQQDPGDEPYFQFHRKQHCNPLSCTVNHDLSQTLLEYIVCLHRTVLIGGANCSYPKLCHLSSQLVILQGLKEKNKRKGFSE